MRKQGNKKYKNWEISYSISGKDNNYSAYANIISVFDTTTTNQLSLGYICNTQQTAEEKIIEKSIDWIDDHTKI